MAQELTLKTNDTPSYFNKDMLLGALIGSFIPIPGVGPLAGIAIATAGGAAIGGYLGEKRMEKEAIMGKKVGEPSFWNKDTLIGGLIGAIGAPFTGIVAGAAVAAVAVVLTATPPVALGLAAIAALGAAAATVVTGAYVGGKLGESRMAKEFQEAKEQNIVNNISKEVSPGVAQAVEYAMANDKTKNWAKHIEDERAMAQGHEQHR